ncbi:MAG: M6 family metalloprotease domain-containing protein [Endomicrobiales bacterium]
MKRVVMPAVFALCAALLASATLSAAPARDPEAVKSKMPGFKSCRVMTPEMLRRMQKSGILRSPGIKGLISNPPNRIFVIRVQFSGGPSFTTDKALAESFFEDLKNYYAETSYSILVPSITVSNSVYTLSSIANYNSETDAELIKLKDDAVAQATVGNDLSGFDYIMIYHAGYGEEDSGNDADIWSLFYPVAYSIDGKSFEGFTVVPERAFRAGSSPLGVICHEFGHQLGLPDLYDTTVSGGRSTCGAWSLMDYPYGFDNTGRNPPHLDAWCRNFLQYIDLSTRLVSSAIPGAFMGDIETSQATGYYKIPIEASGGGEYFIVENRRPDNTLIQYDLDLPGTGLLVWHIDDSIALNPLRLNLNTINNGSPYLGVDLVEADGTAVYSPVPGNPGDAFVQGGIFAYPLSNSFRGQPTDITLSNIALSGNTANCSIGKIAAASGLTVSRLINYPNPAGSGYPHPRQAAGILTTIVLQCTRPPLEVNLTIYDLSGALVRSVERENFSLNLNPSADLKWVFEYDWNGSNDSGEPVAGGVYLYRVKADNEIKVGKLAVVR